MQNTQNVLLDSEDIIPRFVCNYEKYVCKYMKIVCNYEKFICIYLMLLIGYSSSSSIIPRFLQDCPGGWMGGGRDKIEKPLKPIYHL